MRKKFVPVPCAILISLFIYSCSELILPDQIEVQGTLDLPVRIGVANLGSRLAERIEDSFSSGILEGARVYEVDYAGQTVQAFCIYLPIEMTEELNPGELLKTIDRQINDGIHAEPKNIDVSIPYFGIPILIDTIEIVDTIPPVSLADIAQYVKTIDFDGYNNNDETAGIGLNFYFTEIPDGLAMYLECDELNLSSTKPLKQGDNVFGNSGPLQLKLEEYKGDKKLNFFMELQSTGPDPRKWDLTGSGLNIGDDIKIKGEMRFFYVWTKARIDLAAAIKASHKSDDFTGTFPQTPFDLSELQKYLYGGFTFNDLEIKMFITGPLPEKDESHLDLLLTTQYDSREEELYNGSLIIDSEPIKLSDYLNDRECYQYQHLPGWNLSGAGNNEIHKEPILNIFNALPDNLVFAYRPQGELVVTPASFNMFDDSGEGYKITTTLLLMLPMSITATGVDNDKSRIFLPDMFKKDNDLFGRDNPGSLFKSADVDYIRMTIEFMDPVFNGGHLYINEKHDLFPEGIRLNGKRMIVNAIGADLEDLIYPDIQIEIDQGGTINIPKNMGVVDIRFEVKSSIMIGELLE